MNVFELLAKISLDTTEYNKGLDESEKKFSGLGDKISGIGNGIKNGLVTVGKVGAAAIGAAATAVGVLAKQSVEGYAAQEQLIGGIETLYKNASGKMIQYANDAFKTAGMSANEYMETAIESSAAMINSLGGDTEKAAEMTNMAIVDMSDNVNKMGTSMESLQFAYRGFSRGNFTMLDNLALGFSGTKQGMQDLLDKAHELSGVKYDISSYADIVQAIHVVQDSMGITGTTAKEASETISGSIASLQTAWQNLVVGFSNDNADIDQLINNVVTSAETAFGNIMPVIEKALTGIASFIENIAPVLAEKLPAMVETVIPPLLSAATSIVEGFVSALPAIIQILLDQAPVIIGSIITTVIELLPQFVELGKQIVTMLASGVSDNSEGLLEKAFSLLEQYVTFLQDNMPRFLQKGREFVQNIAEGVINNLPALIEKAGELLNKVFEYWTTLIPLFLRQGGEFVVGLARGLLTKLPDVITNVGNIVSNMISKFMSMLPELVKTGMELLGSLAQGIVDNLPAIIEATARVVFKLIAEFASHMPEIIQTGFDILGWVLKGVLEFIPEIPGYIFKVAWSIADAFLSFDWIDIGVQIVKGIIGGITSLGGAIWDAAGAVADKLTGRTEEDLEINSPSKKFAYYGRMVDEGFAKGLLDNASSVESAMNELTGMTAETGTMTVAAAGSSGNGANEAGYFNRIIDLMEQLLTKDNTVNLTGDAADIFRTVRRENNIFEKRTGYSAI